MDLPQIRIGTDLLQDALVSSIQVSQELNEHWTCTITCRQGFGERISVESFLGQPVALTGIDESQSEAPLFTGFVLSVDLIYEPGGAFGAKVVAVSNSWKLDLAPHKRYYDDKSLAEVASAIAGASKQTIAVGVPAQKKLDYVQYGETDFAFLNRMVDDYGAWMRPTPTGLQIAAVFQPGTTVQWREKADLLDFKISGTLAPASFSGSHYDFHAMQSQTFNGVTKKPTFYPAGAANLVSAVSSESASALPSGFVTDRSRVMENAVFKETLEDEAERSIGGSIFGMGHTRNPHLMAGNELTIAGPMDAAGTYGLIKVTHTWDASGYSNAFVCTPWKNFRSPRAPEMPVWNGVVFARVTAHNDPKKMGRIQVQFFWQETNCTHWARATSPHAGPNRGFMFMPEVGDEVAVAFEDGDPERPIIIGALWNGVQNAPRNYFNGFAMAQNDVKKIMTKGGNIIMLSDQKGEETILLTTPDGQYVHITAKSAATSRPSIRLFSPNGDIVLSAPNGRVHIESLYYSKDISPPSSQILTDPE